MFWILVPYFGDILGITGDLERWCLPVYLKKVGLLECVPGRTLSLTTSWHSAFWSAMMQIAVHCPISRCPMSHCPISPSPVVPPPTAWCSAQVGGFNQLCQKLLKPEAKLFEAFSPNKTKVVDTILQNVSTGWKKQCKICKGYLCIVSYSYKFLNRSYHLKIEIKKKERKPNYKRRGDPVGLYSLILIL